MSARIKKEKITPAFKTNNIPIVFNFSKSYVPQFTVCLLSAMRYFSEENNYDIVILERALTAEHKEMIASIIEDHPNVSVRYANPESFFKGMRYAQADRLPLEGFFRAAASFYLDQYDKIVYMDADTLVKRDMADLYRTEVGNCYVAAVNDIVAQAFLHMRKKTPYATDFVYRAKYRMKLKDPTDYFNSGVMVMNCAQIRRDFKWQDMMDYWKRVEYKCDDQDMFNSLFEGKVKYLDMSWNTFAKTNEAFALVYEKAPAEIYQRYLDARKHPNVVHYITEVKPWCVGQGDFVMEFWHLARKSPYYEALLEQMAGFLSQNVNNYVMYQMEHRKLRYSMYNFCKKIVNFFLPLGTRRHEVVKSWYYSLRGWDYISPFEVKDYSLEVLHGEQEREEDDDDEASDSEKMEKGTNYERAECGVK